MLYYIVTVGLVLAFVKESLTMLIVTIILIFIQLVLQKDIYFDAYDNDDDEDEMSFELDNDDEEED